MTYSCSKIVRATTASADVDWQRAWKLAAPVVVAAGRYLDANADGDAGLIEDAYYGLLRAVCDYKYPAETPEEPTPDAA